MTEPGAAAVPGSPTDTEILREAAARADAVVHAAVDFTDPAVREVEEPAPAAMLAGLGSGEPFLCTGSGTVSPGRAGAVGARSPISFDKTEHCSG